MAQQALTDLGIKKLAPPKVGQVELWDARIPGFGIRVSRAGTKAFVLVYRFHGRARRVTLGRYPFLSLGDARARAQEALGLVALGRDPATEKIRARHSNHIENFGGFVTHFIDTYARPKNRSADETQRLLQREFVSVWGDRRVVDITKQDVIAVLDHIMQDGRHTMANRSLAAVRKLFNWAVERGAIEQSPCAGITKPAKEVSRDRVLTDGELRAVWEATVATDYPFGLMVQMLILTGQRRSEISSMRWSDLDKVRGVWSIPAESTKAGRPHSVLLTKQVQELLARTPRFDTDLVFPARGQKHRPFSGFGKCKARLDELCGVRDWTLHDLRRTFSTIQARVGTPPHITERILNHQVGSLTAVAKIYNRYSYFDEMREAMCNYEKELQRILSIENA